MNTTHIPHECLEQYWMECIATCRAQMKNDNLLNKERVAFARQLPAALVGFDKSFEVDIDYLWECWRELLILAAKMMKNERLTNNEQLAWAKVLSSALMVHYPKFRNKKR